MKKQILFFTILILLTASVFSEGITVTFPRGGNNLYKISSYRITWTSTVCQNRVFKINIFKNQINEANFVEQLIATNTTSKEWTIPRSYTSGNYIIRVKTENNNCLGDSGVFTIHDPPTIDITVDVAGDDPEPPVTPIPRLHPAKKNIPGLNKNILKVLKPSIKINYPDNNTNWRLKLGNTSLPFPIRVQWEKTGIESQDNYVKIFLKRVVNGLQTTLLTQRTRNSGLFRGEIRRDLRTSLYTIIIQTLDGKIRVESDPFHITNAENDSN